MSYSSNLYQRGNCQATVPIVRHDERREGGHEKTGLRAQTYAYLHCLLTTTIVLLLTDSSVLPAHSPTPD